MKHQNYLTCLMIFLFIISCSKDNIDNKTVMAGMVNANMNYFKFRPDSLQDIWNGKFSDSIDFNSDNNYDIKFAVNGTDGFGGSIHFYWLSIQTLNHDTYILTDTIYPKVLSIGDTINIQTSWKFGDLILLDTSPECCPPTGRTFYYGNWKEKLEKYIGIKNKGKFGWVKISVPNVYSIIIHDYAITK